MSFFQKLQLFAFIISGSINAFSQDKTSPDTASYQGLSDFFQHGKFNGHTRSFFMSTINNGRLRDDYALATGAGIGYRSAPFHGFGFGLNGFFIFNVFSSELNRPEPNTGQLNRYEIGLFDVTQPANKRDLDRLEEAYLYYQYKGGQLTFGRMNINTPFVNPQDGRMRPSLEEGIDWKGKKGKLSYQVAALWAMSPRSTVLWYKVDESIGTYPVGVNAQGKKSGYAGKLSSKGLAIAGLTWDGKNNQSQVWSTLIDNINHTLLVQNEHQFSTNFMVGLQYTRQDRINNGGNANSLYTYMENKAAQVYSGRVQYQKEKTQLNLNYSNFTKQGRFLFPREWGREPFYTFIPRERTEGTANAQAVTLGFQQKEWLKNPLQLNMAIGYFDLPGVNEFDQNKYGMGDYVQANLQLKYAPQASLKGLTISTLLMAKKNVAGYLSEKNLNNKSDMAHFELIVDYKFGQR